MVKTLLKRLNINQLQQLQHVTKTATQRVGEFTDSEMTTLEQAMQQEGYTFLTPSQLEDSAQFVEVPFKCNLSCNNAPKMQTIRNVIATCVSYDMALLQTGEVQPDVTCILNQHVTISGLEPAMKQLMRNAKLLKNVEITDILSHGKSGAARVVIQDIHHQITICNVFIRFKSTKKDAAIQHLTIDMYKYV